MGVTNTSVIGKHNRLNNIAHIYMFLYHVYSYRCLRWKLVFCSCKKLVAARKQMSILQAPNILVIQLKVGSVSACCFYVVLALG